MRRRQPVGAGIVLAVCLVIAGPWLMRQLRIDGCLDRGGRWDHALGACEESPDRAAIGACFERGGEWDHRARRCLAGEGP